MSPRAVTILFIAASVALPVARSAASDFTTLYTFTGGADGGGGDSLVPGPHGSLLGSVTVGGASGFGLVFQLTPPAQGGDTWAFSVVHSFSGGADGAFPERLLVDAAGNVFGEADLGGSGQCQAEGYKGCGLVFQLAPPAKGQTAWTETVLYNFQGGKDGFYPQDGLVQDAGGHLFGTTLQSTACGFDGCGTAFELSPPSQGQTEWTKTTLWTFTKAKDGRDPFFTMTLDKAGNLYGITKIGGSFHAEACEQNGCGVVYMLSPPANGGVNWTEKTLSRFNQKNGAFPFTSLTLDAAGNILGLTNGGGSHDAKCPLAYGCGVIYELSPPANDHNAWSLFLPWKFTNGVDGAFPLGASLIPFHGKYITTTSGDEVSTYGSIDMFTPSSDQHTKWKEDTLFTFEGDANGENPSTPLIERNGIFYGLTAGGTGPDGSPVNGTIYSFKP